MHPPTNPKPRFHVLQSLIGEVFETVETVGREAVTRHERGAAFFDHTATALLIAVPGSIGNDHGTVSSGAAKRFGHGLFVILRVVKGGIEDHEVELTIGKGQIIVLRLKSRKERR